MTKSFKSIDDMFDYVRQLRKHTEARRAIHVKLSVLEKHFREEHYRRFVATSLRPLITKHGATMFALPNTDVVLIVKGASIDTIDPLLNNIRRKYRDSSLVSGIDVIQGVSDAFVSWFDLEKEYEDFLTYTKALADRLKGTAPSETPLEATVPERKRTPGLLELNARPPKPLSASSKIQMIALGKRPDTAEKRSLDIDLAHTIQKALHGVDITGMVRRQSIMAIVGTQSPKLVMVHKFVPPDVVFSSLMKTEVTLDDPWLLGYLEGLFADKMIVSTRAEDNDESIVSSLRVSCASVCSPLFDKFTQSLGKHKRSALLIEFGAVDVMADFSTYIGAHEKLDDLGYKVSVADIDPRTLLWMDYANLGADFVKLYVPDEPIADWSSTGIEQGIKDRIQKIGLARIILDGCHKQEDIALGQRLGVTLFQGSAVDAVSKG